MAERFISQLALLSILGKIEQLSWSLGRGRLTYADEIMTKPLQEETASFSQTCKQGGGQ